MEKQFVQGSPEWHELRRTRIGASDAPIIMGQSPFKTPRQLWEEKLAISSTKVHPGLFKGKEGEEEARHAFMKATGICVCPAVILHPEYEWLMASLDGITLDGKEGVEIKIPNADDHLTAQRGGVPVKYYAQLQVQMVCTGLDHWNYWSYRDGEGVHVVLFRDDTYIKNMIPKLKKFWDMWMNLEEPPLMERDYLPKDNDEIWMGVAKEYKEKARALKELKDEVEDLKHALINLSENHNCEGNGVRVTKYFRKGFIKYSEIPELIDVDLDQYRGQSIKGWRIT